MTDINRSVVIIKPKQPYLDWVRMEEDELCQSTALAELRDDCPAYLVRTVWEPDDAQKMIGECWEKLFERALEGWITDESAWPKNRTLKMFREWFDVDCHSLVVDLCSWETGELGEE